MRSLQTSATSRVPKEFVLLHLNETVRGWQSSCLLLKLRASSVLHCRRSTNIRGSLALATSESNKFENCKSCSPQNFRNSHQRLWGRRHVARVVKMGTACKILITRPEEKHHMRDLDVDREILEWLLKKQGVSFWPRLGTSDWLLRRLHWVW
jgi:hypothetical protein